MTPIHCFSVDVEGFSEGMAESCPIPAGMVRSQREKDEIASNVDEILGALEEESQRLRLVERAYSDVVGSGVYTYRSFVQRVLRTALQETRPVTSSREAHPMIKSSWARLRVAERLGWAKPRLRGLISTLFYGLVRRFPRSFGRWAEARRKSRVGCHRRP